MIHSISPLADDTPKHKTVAGALKIYSAKEIKKGCFQQPFPYMVKMLDQWAYWGYYPFPGKDKEENSFSFLYWAG